MILQAPALDDRAQTIEHGRACRQRFDAGELEALWEELSPALQQGLGSPQGLSAFREQVREQLGTETAIIDESADRQGDRHLFRRVSRFERCGGLIETVFAFDGEGFVVWGGRTLA